MLSLLFPKKKCSICTFCIFWKKDLYPRNYHLIWFYNADTSLPLAAFCEYTVFDHEQIENVHDQNLNMWLNNWTPANRVKLKLAAV